MYKDVSYTTSAGLSEFTPGPDSTPAIGKRGERERVEEVKVEVTTSGEEQTREVVKKLREAHPYEEVAVDVYKLEDF